MLLPKLGINSASYDLDRVGVDPARRVSNHSNLQFGHVGGFERPFTCQSGPDPDAGAAHSVCATPYVDQSDIPLFDSAPGVRICTPCTTRTPTPAWTASLTPIQITLGVNSRMVSSKPGAELMNVGMVQRCCWQTSESTRQHRTHHAAAFRPSIAGRHHRDPQLDTRWHLAVERHQAPHQNAAPSAFATRPAV